MHEYMIFRRLIKKTPWALHLFLMYFMFLSFYLLLCFKANFVKKLNKIKEKYIHKIYPKIYLQMAMAI